MTIFYEQWYRIPQYNGYEIVFSKYYSTPNSVQYNFRGDQCIVTLRSWKNFNQYPNGYILTYFHYNSRKKKWKEYYELTNLSNKRDRITIHAIIRLIEDYDLDYTTEEQIPNPGSEIKYGCQPIKSRSLQQQHYQKKSLLEISTHQSWKQRRK